MKGVYDVCECYIQTCLIAITFFCSTGNLDLKQFEEERNKLNKDTAKFKQDIKKLNDENETLRYLCTCTHIKLVKFNILSLMISRLQN